MKKCRLIWVLMLIVLCLYACSKKETYNIDGKTYYSTTAETNSNEFSQVWFGADKSFVLTDYFFDGINEMVGSWSIKENVITLDVEKSGVGEYEKVLFEIIDEHKIVLKSNIAGSNMNQEFTDEKPTATNNYNTYYNVSQSDKNKSYLELRNDGSFAFIDQNDFGIMEYNGLYTIEDNNIVIKYNDGAQDQTVKFLIKEDKTLELQSNVGVSAAGDIFDSNYKPENNSNSSTGNVACTEIKTKYNSYWANKGVKNYNLGVTLVPANTTDTVYYSSDDKSVVEVDIYGNCTAIGKGKTKIHIRCGNIEKTVEFETKEASKEVTEIKLDKTKIVMPLGGREPVGATALPETAEDKTLTYTSSDTNVLKIIDGEIHPQKPGVAKITVTANNGVSATIDVCIEGAMLEAEFPKDQHLVGGSGEIIYFEVYKLKCENWNVTKEDLRLYAPAEVSDPSLLSIDNKGRAIADGNTVSSTQKVGVRFVWESDDDFPEGAYTETYYVYITK